MEYLLTVLLLFNLGCLVHLERQVSSLNTKITRMEKNNSKKRG